MQRLLNKSRFLLTLFVTLVCSSIYGQSVDDKALLLKQNFSNSAYNKRQVSYLFKDSKNVILKYNPVSLTLGGLMFFYQKIVSAQLLSDCPYEISCSNFSKSVIKRYGIIKGLAISSDRLMRCNSIAAKDLSIFDFNEKHKLIDNPDQYCSRH